MNASVLLVSQRCDPPGLRTPYNRYIRIPSSLWHLPGIIRPSSPLCTDGLHAQSPRNDYPLLISPLIIICACTYSYTHGSGEDLKKAQLTQTTMREINQKTKGRKHRDFIRHFALFLFFNSGLLKSRYFRSSKNGIVDINLTVEARQFTGVGDSGSQQTVFDTVILQPRKKGP